MNPLILSIVVTGFFVAFFHAALPTHWLPFALAGRAQGWEKPKTLAVTAFCSLGHALFTTVLGIVVVFLGIAAKSWIGDVFPLIAGGFLVLLGLYFFWRQYKGKGGHLHWHLPGVAHTRGHDHDHDHDGHHHHGRKSDKAVIAGLFGMLTFSPCEGFLPVYFSGIPFGWSGFAILSLVLAMATACGMVFFTWLTLHGFERLKLKYLERHEAAILGGLFCLIGLIVMLVKDA